MLDRWVWLDATVGLGASCRRRDAPVGFLSAWDQARQSVHSHFERVTEKVNKIIALARAAAIILAVVTGFVAIASLNVPLVLVSLGLIAGLGYGEDDMTRLVLTVLVLPIAGAALSTLPSVGAQLEVVATNLAVAIAGAAATVLACRCFNLVKGDLSSLTG